MLDIPVLIVGGGPVGLTLSILLSRLGVRSLLVERHRGTAVLPKARAINARSMEMYRQLGMEDDIRAVAMPERFGGTILWAESLAGAEINRLHPAHRASANRDLSVTRSCGCSQDLLEPVLRRHAEHAPGDVRFGVELTELTCGDDHVRATLVDAAGSSEAVRARYLVAADGARSGVRTRLGIERQGERDVYDSVNIHFRADLTRWIADRPAALYLIEQPELRGTFLTINGTDRWGFLVTSLSHYGYTPDQFTPEFCTRIIRRAVGCDELAVEVLGVGAWTASALVAERYRSGPVFLAGDAAHEMPPTGGFGLNTGVQDAQNLAWKLAAVLHDEAGEALLDSYDAERRPVGEVVTRTSLLNALSMGRTSRQDQPVLPRKQFLNEIGLVFGARYASSAVAADGPDAAPPEQIETYVPSGDPGGRAPHVVLERGERHGSTLDLLGNGFVLFTAPAGERWREAAARIASPRIASHVIGGDGLEDPDGAWLEAYGIEPDGAVLVRPDGYVAWRSKTGAGAETRLDEAIDRILSRPARAGRRADATGVSGLHHFTIGCTVDELPLLLDFYTRTLGLRDGPRPGLRHPGHWLYVGDRAIVHLNALLSMRPIRASDSLDHVALTAHGLDATRAALRAARVPFSEAPLKGTSLHQVFVIDPLGLKVELNFDLAVEGRGAD